MAVSVVRVFGAERTADVERAIGRSVGGTEELPKPAERRGEGTAGAAVAVVVSSFEDVAEGEGVGRVGDGRVAGRDPNPDSTRGAMLGGEDWMRPGAESEAVSAPLGVVVGEAGAVVGAVVPAMPRAICWRRSLRSFGSLVGTMRGVVELGSVDGLERVATRAGLVETEVTALEDGWGLGRPAIGLSLAGAGDFWPDEGRSEPGRGFAPSVVAMTLEAGCSSCCRGGVA